MRLYGLYACLLPRRGHAQLNRTLTLLAEAAGTALCGAAGVRSATLLPQSELGRLGTAPGPPSGVKDRSNRCVRKPLWESVLFGHKRLPIITQTTRAKDGLDSNHGESSGNPCLLRGNRRK